MEHCFLGYGAAARMRVQGGPVNCEHCEMPWCTDLLFTGSPAGTLFPRCMRCRDKAHQDYTPSLHEEHVCSTKVMAVQES